MISTIEIAAFSIPLGQAVHTALGMIWLAKTSHQGAGPNRDHGRRVSVNGRARRIVLGCE